MVSRLLAVTVLLTVLTPAVPAAAEPPGHATRDPGNGAERIEVAATALPAIAGLQNSTIPGTPSGPPAAQTGYPRQTRLRVYPEDPTDRSMKLGLTPYHGIAPALMALQASSDRVSAEVIGRSTLGRDLYLVTITAPESPAEARRQAGWRALIEDDPRAAARNRSLAAHYKTPIWINGNIHGDEWEGADGALRLAAELAAATDAATGRLLERTRIYLTITNNPDGRVAGTRVNGAGFDLNRDHVTFSQPESRAIRDTLIATQPLLMLDEHGYTGTTLIEPSTAPHGQNYDYDLYIKHAYPNALGMEAAVAALGYAETSRADIPFRDYAPGDWDDWPPIFTAMYAIYHGAVGHTVEVPLQVNRSAYNSLPVAELRRRAAINTDVAEATIRAAIGYADANRAALLADQIELFRRGWAGEPQRFIPDGYVPGFGPEDRYTAQFPRAYVIPAGAGQRSPAAAARLVDHLVANDVRVKRAKLPFWSAGRWYPAGSYVVDLHQPKRGLANALLEAGRDISGDVPQMYDISGWSHGLLWGATVDASRREMPRVPAESVTVADPTGAVLAPPGRELALTLTDGKDVQAVNALLDAGVVLRHRADGTVLVPASAWRTAGTFANRFGVRFTAATPGPAGAVLIKPVLAAAVAADELFVLRELGFDVRPVSTALLNSGVDLTGVDTLIVSSGLSYPALNPAAKAEIDSFLTDGGVVTRGATGARFNADTGLLPVRVVSGRADANGVVSVQNGTGAVSTGALPHSFVYAPLWFTDLGVGVATEQRYAATPLVAGHWRANADGSGGPDQAAGQAAVVSGIGARGTAAVLFGTEPLFRAHPKGLYTQVARAIYWTSTSPAALPVRSHMIGPRPPTDAR